MHIRSFASTVFFFIFGGASLVYASRERFSEDLLENWEKPDDAVLRRSLSLDEYRVTQQSSTEPPFQNRFWDHHAEGIYVDVVSGQPLFSSLDKFDSGSGWPSFTKPIDSSSVVERLDKTHNMRRIEIRSVLADSHLGHLFSDGPEPGGTRYCVNSCSLKFVPAEQLERYGYGPYAALFPAVQQAPRGAGGDALFPAVQQAPRGAGGDALHEPDTFADLEGALLAGGCFWGMEELIRSLPGVVDVTVGYSGGTDPSPTYERVKTGTTGHAECIRVTFHPSTLSFEELLRFFFRIHDPTTLNRQGGDIGSQYRSAIFYTSEDQRVTAERVRAAVQAAGMWTRPIVTEITAAGIFYQAEAYHQDYLQLHPGGYTCHYLRD